MKVTRFINRFLDRAEGWIDKTEGKKQITVASHKRQTETGKTTVKRHKRTVKATEKPWPKPKAAPKPKTVSRSKPKTLPKPAISLKPVAPPVMSGVYPMLFVEEVRQSSVQVHGRHLVMYYHGEDMSDVYVNYEVSDPSYAHGAVAPERYAAMIRAVLKKHKYIQLIVGLQGYIGMRYSPCLEDQNPGLHWRGLVAEELLRMKVVVPADRGLRAVRR